MNSRLAREQVVLLENAANLWASRRKENDLNVWIYVFIYCTNHISCLMAVCNSSEWDRTSACEGASGCRYQCILDLTHPANPCMSPCMERFPTPGTTCPSLFGKFVGTLTSPANHEVQETGPTAPGDTPNYGLYGRHRPKGVPFSGLR